MAGGSGHGGWGGSMTAQQPPRLVVVGGPNGAGKTTLACAYADAHGLRYLGADDIAAQLSPQDPAAARVAAARGFSRALRQAVAAGESLVVESTLSGGSLGAHLAAARQAGYALTLVMVYLDSVELCLRRVAQRVAAGGHDVPEADVRRRYGRSLQQFLARYRLLADDWLVVFNGEAGYVTVAEGSGGQMASVLDEARWAQLIEQSVAGVAPDTEEKHD
ncbi:Zeta toxin family protein [Sphaerotilus sulfidivorans]|uniref:Zeta toxin family protein n=2 Tax=Sphaerotilus sulfidivorans TaxID=639200 RepID=A0A5C1Q107_9BURK|nr:Zeta toxin family protein [Sphaerotilus sulfidivorans]